uniref:Uncharacterized protein n=1 Tax=Anguilla anguilla TaxID=7936 RepID=A0A0E9U675_ANGAN
MLNNIKGSFLEEVPVAFRRKYKVVDTAARSSLLPSRRINI